MLPADRPVSPEAAPPRATTPEPNPECVHCGAYRCHHFGRAEYCNPTCLDRGKGQTFALSAAPSQEIGGLLKKVQRLYLANQTDHDAQRERDEVCAGITALAVEAREAERLRAAAQAVVDSAEEGSVTTVSGNRLNALRASLRATPPETTTQETTP